MKKSFLKIIGLLVILSFISTNGYGQVHKLRTTSFNFRQKINEYKWSEWVEETEASVLITFDLTNDRITIYSNEKQVYDIAEFEGSTVDKDGDDVYSYYCVDESGQTCRVKWLKLNSQNGRMQLYVYYSDLNWLYNVYSLD